MVLVGGPIAKPIVWSGGHSFYLTNMSNYRLRTAHALGSPRVCANTFLRRTERKRERGGKGREPTKRGNRHITVNIAGTAPRKMASALKLLPLAATGSLLQHASLA